MSAPAIELVGISKAFGPVQANRAVSLVVPAGSSLTIHDSGSSASDGLTAWGGRGGDGSP